MTNKYMRAEIAIDVIAEMLGDIANGYDKDNENREKLHAKYLDERDAIYSGDEDVIEYVIKTYGPVIKAKYVK